MSSSIDGGNDRGIERLTARQITAWIRRPAKGIATRKLADGGGLYLVRLPSGAASWQVKYRYLNSKPGDKNFGKLTERTFSAGSASTTSLAEARAARRHVKELIKQGIAPVQDRRVHRAEKVASSGNLFSDVATAWLQKKKASPQKNKTGWSEIHYTKSKQAIDRDVLPWLGALPVHSVTPAMIAAVIERIQNRGARDTASKILQHVRSVFRLAAAKGMRTDNPADAVIEILNQPDVVRHYPALLTFAELGDVLRRAEAASITATVRQAHRLVAFTATRIANTVAARWDDFDLDAKPAMWIIPRAQMKIRGREHDHKVVLPETIANELRAWHKAHPESGEYVFPGRQGGNHLSRESVEKMMRVTLSLEDKHSPHSWRSSFSTLAKEDGAFAREVVDLALDHVHDTTTARSYDRGERLMQRIKLMTWWGEALQKAQQHTTKVTPIRKRSAA